MSKPVKTGGVTKSQRQHLEIAARAGNAEAIALLKEPPLPYCLEYLWQRYMVLHNTRSYTEFGMLPVTGDSVQAWSKLLDWRMKPHEIEALIAIDAAYRNPEERDHGRRC